MTDRIESKQKIHRWLSEIVLVLLFFLASFGVGVQPVRATGVYDLPVLNAGADTWFIDQADAISRSNEGTLISSLKKLAANTGNEVRMVAINRLDYGETIDSFSDKLFDKWFPEAEDRANQTVLVIDTLTNNIAIRTGDAIKKLMPDEVANSVAQETAAAPIREGAKYNQAFLDARTRLVAILSGQEDPGPPDIKTVSVEGTFTSAEETNGRSATVWVVVLLILATAIPMATYFWYVGFD